MTVPTSQGCCENLQDWREKASDHHPGILPLSLCWGKFKSRKRAEPKGGRAPARGVGRGVLGSRRGGVTRGDAGRCGPLPRPPARLRRRQPGCLPDSRRGGRRLGARRPRSFSRGAVGRGGAPAWGRDSRPGSLGGLRPRRGAPGRVTAHSHPASGSPGGGLRATFPEAAGRAEQENVRSPVRSLTLMSPSATLSNLCPVPTAS